MRRLFRGGRIVDLCGGHGLLAQTLLLLDDSSADALVADAAIPSSSVKVRDALVQAWPRLASRVTFVEADIEEVEVCATDLIVSIHACGALTDRVIDCAVTARARVAVLPCCHDAAACDTGDLAGWIDPAIAIDATRAARLRQRGYRIWTQTIPAETSRHRTGCCSGSPEGSLKGCATSGHPFKSCATRTRLRSRRPSGLPAFPPVRQARTPAR